MLFFQKTQRRHKLTCSLCSLLAGIGLAGPVQAQADGATVPTDTLQEVVVSARRYPEQVFKAPFSIHRTGKPMQDMRQARTTPEALAYVPGVFVQKTNHGGGSPFLRGLTGNQTLLMLDGIRVNNASFRFGPNQYPNLIDAFSLDRIEVLKGSGSVQYGSDAMGGVIHAITQDVAFAPAPAWHLNAGGRLTSQDMEYTGRAEAGYSGEKVAVAGGYTWRQFGDLYGGDSTGRQSPSGYDERNWNLKAKFALSPRATLTLSAQQVNQFEVPLYHRVQLENFAYYYFDPQRMLISYARLAVQTRGGALRQWSITPVYKKSIEARRYHRNGNANYFAEKDAVQSLGTVVETNWQLAGNWTSNTGVEWYFDKVASERLVTNAATTTRQRGLYPDGATQLNASLYSLHHLRWHKLSLEAGARYNVLQNNIPAKNLNVPGALFDNARVSSSALVGNLSVLYQLHNKQVLFANTSTGFRAPSIDDMGTLGLVDFRYEIPNYNLKPEKNINTEIGYRYRGKKLQLQAAVFYMHLRDLISRVRRGTDSLEGFPVFIKTNDQQAMIRGFELSGSAQLSPRLSLQAMVAAQHGQNLTRREPVRRIPPMHGLMTLRYERTAWYLAADHQWAAKQTRLAQGDKDDNRIPKGGTPGWQLINLHAGYNWPAITLRATLANLLNEDYRTHGSGINGMGRALTVSAFFTVQKTNTTCK